MPSDTKTCSGRFAAEAATSVSLPRSRSSCIRSVPWWAVRCCGRWTVPERSCTGYREFIATAPDEINGFFAFLKVPPGPPFPEELHFRTMCGIVWCFIGAPAEADVVFAPIRSIAGGPLVDLVSVLPYPALQSLFDALYPAGLQWYLRADFVNELSDAAIDLHIEHASRMPSVQSGMHLYPINGAAGRA